MFKSRELLVVLAIYSLISLLYYDNVINSVFWLIIIVYLVGSNKIKNVEIIKDDYTLISLLLFSSILLYIGYIYGFSISPYRHDVSRVLYNIFITLIPVIGIELSRYYVVIKNYSNKLVLILINIIFIFLEIKLNFQLSFIISVVIINVLLTYLTIVYKNLTPILYRVITTSLTIFLPLVPNINYNLYLLITLLLFMYVLLLDSYKSLFISFLVFLVFMFVSIKYECVTILSNSMYPYLERGDLVIYSKVNDISDIDKKDIILYKRGEDKIMHRVIDKFIKDDEVWFIVKGEVNNTSEIVNSSDVKGIYKKRIKYLGYPSIWVSNYLN